ncbi:MAG: DUF2461 family protein [Gammaproteobacteria bacterium]|nr:DUF2461 family protein [Gammaproteobacteria bacterium]
MTRYACFESRTIRFLEALKANNNREWFKEHKSRYEDDVLVNPPKLSCASCAHR